MLRIFILIAICLFVFTSVCSADQGTRFDSQLDLDEAEYQLAHEPIVEKTSSLKDVGGSEAGGIVTFASGVRAIFKLSDVRLAELAMYKMSKWLVAKGAVPAPGFVSPTVLRTIDGKEVSLQLWIDHYDKRKTSATKPLPEVLDKLGIIRFVMGDYYGPLLRHQLWISKTSLVLVDNSEIFWPTYSKYGQRKIFAPTPIDKKTPTLSPWKDRVFPFGRLSKEKLNASTSKKKSVKKFIDLKFVIWNNLKWIQSDMRKDNKGNDVQGKEIPKAIPKAKVFPPELIKALKDLGRRELKAIWGDRVPQRCRQRVEQLIDLTLMRKQQILALAAGVGKS